MGLMFLLPCWLASLFPYFIALQVLLLRRSRRGCPRYSNDERLYQWGNLKPHSRTFFVSFGAFDELAHLYGDLAGFDRVDYSQRRTVPKKYDRRGLQEV